jgi:hypothetical protein
MGKYFARYKGYIAGTLGMNVLAALFNVFSFTVLLPILQILFKINTERYEYMPWSTDHLLEVAKNNGYYYKLMRDEKTGLYLESSKMVFALNKKCEVKKPPAYTNARIIMMNFRK